MNNEYLFSYSKNLSSYLMDQGFKYITKARRIDNPDSVFWLFKKSDAIISALEEYDKLKQDNVEF
ncbi:hypothetical protein [Tenuibacillus multivorans]|uniref:DUF5659 domain-containing protein n=1 Tax=Tenuibacillus multivorans TaxID=237069 RepID=A0A1G9XQC7_9BACI|nr:hypothetical protein [Tenuibacillus multivorans]GEL75774.1 hypothetical protein TMU01_00090 [Tenuibacillus multivorans]SDM99022.1 hypothetical protein SAMN05216498_1068 [Tenuibacillus multivorans]